MRMRICFNNDAIILSGHCDDPKHCAIVSAFASAFEFEKYGNNIVSPALDITGYVKLLHFICDLHLIFGEEWAIKFSNEEYQNEWDEYRRQRIELDKDIKYEW